MNGSNMIFETSLYSKIICVYEAAIKYAIPLNPVVWLKFDSSISEYENESLTTLCMESHMNTFSK